MDLQGNYKAIIFDLDGVLVNSEPIHCLAWLALLVKYGRSYYSDWYNQWIGVDAIHMAECIVINEKLNVDPQFLAQQKEDIFYKLIEKTPLILYRSVAQELNKLNGFKLGMATSSPRKLVNHVLKTNALYGKFESIVTVGDVRQLKPNPEIYLKSAEQLGLLPEQCIVIEDSKHGVESAKKAGMLVLAVESTCDKKILCNADMIFESTAIALSWINKQQEKELELCMQKL